MTTAEVCAGAEVKKERAPHTPSDTPPPGDDDSVQLDYTEGEEVVKPEKADEDDDQVHEGLLGCLSGLSSSSPCQGLMREGLRV